MSSSLYVYANITHKKRKVNSRRRKNFKKRTIDHKIRHLDQKKTVGSAELGLWRHTTSRGERYARLHLALILTILDEAERADGGSCAAC